MRRAGWVRGSGAVDLPNGVTAREAAWWGAGLSIALALHASTFLLLPKDDETGAANLGESGVEVALGRAGGAPGSVDAMVAPTPQSKVEPQEVQPLPAETVTTRTVAPEATEPTVPEIPESSDRVPVIEDIDPDLAPPASAQVPTAEMAESAAAKEGTEIKPIEKPVEIAQTKTVEPDEVTTETPASDVSSVAGAAGRSGSNSTPDSGTAAATSGGGTAAASVSYVAKLRQWLERHKEFPVKAQAKRIQGTVLVFFAIDRTGRVLDFRVRRSSGSPMLDAAAEEMIRRANPLPAMPDGMRQARLEVVVPVQFYLR